MPVRFGSATPTAFRLGAGNVGRLMLGPAQVWAAAAPPTPVLLAEGQTGATFTPTATHAVTGLEGVPAGDMIVVFLALGGGSGATSVSVDTAASGTGWTIRDQGARTTACVLACVTKTAAGSDALTLTSNATSYGAWQAWRIPGGAASVTAGTRVSNFSSGSADPPALTPPGGTRPYLWFAAAAIGGNVSITGGPANYSAREDTLNSLTTSAGKLTTAWRTLTAGTEDPGAFTCSASINFVVNTFAFAA